MFRLLLKIYEKWNGVFKGGFGNQLFQLSFANFLKQNDFNVSINMKFLKDDGYSTQEI